MTDADGQMLTPGGGNGSGGEQDAVRSQTVYFSAGNREGKPAKLTWELPAEVVELRILSNSKISRCHSEAGVPSCGKPASSGRGHAAGRHQRLAARGRRPFRNAGGRRQFVGGLPLGVFAEGLHLASTDTMRLCM